MGQATAPVTDASFDSDVIKAKTPVLVDFWAEWCGPCRALAPKLEELAVQFKDQVSVLKLNIDENPKIPTQFGVRGIPTIILFKDGKEVEQIVGNHPKENIEAMIKRHT